MLLPKKEREKPKKVKDKTKRGLFNLGLVKITATAMIVVCAALLFTTEQDCHKKEQELAAIQTKIDAYNIENEDLKRTLESDDMSAYMEKVAIEERGYAYPDERRFYDTSRD